MRLGMQYSSQMRRVPTLFDLILNLGIFGYWLIQKRDLPRLVSPGSKPAGEVLQTELHQSITGCTPDARKPGCINLEFLV